MLPSDTDAAKSILSSISEETMKEACESLQRNFHPDDDDNKIKWYLSITWQIIDDFHSQAYDSKLNLKGHIRNQADFKAYVNSDKKKQELVNLLRSMAKKKVPCRNLLENGTLLLSF
jgi:hypothetical protein